MFTPSGATQSRRHTSSSAPTRRPPAPHQVGEGVVDRERSTSKSAVSREFVGRTGEHLRALISRSLEDVRLAALMLDGIELKGRCCVVCLGVTTDGVKVPLGLWDGSTENATVARHLLADLVDRGLDCEQGVLVVLDGGKALRSAVGQSCCDGAESTHAPSRSYERAIELSANAVERADLERRLAALNDG